MSFKSHVNVKFGPLEKKLHRKLKIMAFRVAGIGSGFETILPLVHGATIALNCLSDSPMNILHSQLNSGAHR